MLLVPIVGFSFNLRIIKLPVILIFDSLRLSRNLGLEEAGFHIYFLVWRVASPFLIMLIGGGILGLHSLPLSSHIYKLIHSERLRALVIQNA